MHVVRYEQHSGTCWACLIKVRTAQGWEFAHQFFKWIAYFLWAKERFALLSWAKGAKRSRSLFCNERHEQFAHSCSFLKRIVNQIANPEALPSLFTQSLFFKEWQEQFRICNSIRDSLLKRVTVSNRYRHSLKKSGWVKSDGSATLLGIKVGKLSKTYKKYVLESNSIESWSNHLQFTHCRSWMTWANRSRLLFC